MTGGAGPRARPSAWASAASPFSSSGGFFELRQKEPPLVDLRTTARPAVLLTNIAAAAIGFGMMAQSIILPMLLRLPEATGYGLGQSILAAGLWMRPAV